jgi:hypothetical protein
MIQSRNVLRIACAVAAIAAALSIITFATDSPFSGRMQKRWLFVWRDLNDLKETDRMIARFPRAKAAGYNGVAFSPNVRKEKAAELKEAAKKNGLDIIAIVMGGISDRNYVEGVPVKDALFVVEGNKAVLNQDSPAGIINGDFEAFTGNHFAKWGFQDDEGVTTFVDQDVKHGGKASLRMENIGKNQNRHCRISQPIKLQPYRQYRISVWLKTEHLSPADPEVKVLTSAAPNGISFQTFRVENTQGWKQYNIVFNSLNNTDARFYAGSWWGKDGKMWWDDIIIEEIGLVNVLRRPGCPVTVGGEDGTNYEEERDYDKIVDPNLHPWIPYHEQPPIKLTPNTRIKNGDRLRVSYYHPLVVYKDRINYCLSEPKIFEMWESEVRQINDMLHPAEFLMSHDEIRVANHCASCQGKNMTAGGLLAWNVKKAAQIIRDIRPDAGIWVWNDMFDPRHNAVDGYYAVNGTLKESWKGLERDVGIVNWHGGLKGKNCQFFADLGLKQILAGYYDGDDSGAAIAEWISSTESVPGIVGAMYTTWEDKYNAMDTWAGKAWGNR